MLMNLLAMSHKNVAITASMEAVVCKKNCHFW